MYVYSKKALRIIPITAQLELPTIALQLEKPTIPV
jgi:hypothetical protein